MAAASTGRSKKQEEALGKRLLGKACIYNGVVARPMQWRPRDATFSAITMADGSVIVDVPMEKVDDPIDEVEIAEARSPPAVEYECPTCPARPGENVEVLLAESHFHGARYPCELLKLDAGNALVAHRDLFTDDRGRTRLKEWMLASAVHLPPPDAPEGWTDQVAGGDLVEVSLSEDGQAGGWWPVMVISVDRQAAPVCFVVGAVSNLEWTTTVGPCRLRPWSAPPPPDAPPAGWVPPPLHCRLEVHTAGSWHADSVGCVLADGSCRASTSGLWLDWADEGERWRRSAAAAALAAPGVADAD